MINGFGSAYLEITYKGKPLPFIVTKFRYVHAEEEDDQCDIDIRTDDPNLVDDPAFTQNSEWVVTWGLIADKLISHTQKIYLEDINPTFDKDGINISVVAHDKATVLKKNPSRGIHKNTSLPALVANAAANHDITTYVEVPPEPIMGNLYTGDLYKDAAAAKKKKDIEKKALIEAAAKRGQSTFKDAMVEYRLLHQDYYADKSNYVQVSPGQFEEIYDNPSFRTRNTGGNALIGPASSSNPNVTILNPAIRDMVKAGKIDPTQAKFALYYLNHFDRYKALPQANKSTAQLAKDLARRNSTGAYNVSGHGNSIVITSRMLKKKPIYTYEYAGGEGLLLSFSPETKHKSKQSGASAAEFTGWNALEKEAYHGSVTDGQNPNTRSVTGGGVVNDAVPLLTNPNRATYLKRAANVSGPSNYGGTFALRDNLVDNTLVPNFVYGESQVKVSEANKKKAADNLSKQIIKPQKDLSNAFGEASNSQATDAYDQNPGTFLAIGNPLIVSGEVVAIKNVGKKFSGNYWIIKATHELDPSTGYLVTGEIGRNSSGNTLSIGDNKGTTKASRNLINKEIKNQSFDNSKSRKVKALHD